jgi:ubiquinone/menaquinone biosynthesis C-methylase UbiE
LHFAEYTKKLYEMAGESMRDIPKDWRVRSVLDMVRKKGTGTVCLEIGGADGPMTPILESLYSTVLTIDSAKSFLKRIEAKTNKTVCLRGDTHFLPISDRSIDLVVLSEVLEHVFIPTQVLMEIRRVLRNDGKCIISVPNEATSNQLNPWRKSKHLPAGDSHVTFYSVDTLRKILFRTGFDIIEYRHLYMPIRPAPSLHFIASLIRRVLGSPSYILCCAKVMDDPDIYWKSLELSIGIKHEDAVLIKR